MKYRHKPSARTKRTLGERLRVSRGPTKQQRSFRRSPIAASGFTINLRLSSRCWLQSFIGRRSPISLYICVAKVELSMEYYKPKLSVMPPHTCPSQPNVHSVAHTSIHLALVFCFLSSIALHAPRVVTWVPSRPDKCTWLLPVSVTI